VAIDAIAPFGIDELAMYPLFDDALLELFRTRIARERHDRIARTVIIRARRPAAGERAPGRARRSH
jgi:hypothetical protein